MKDKINLILDYFNSEDISPSKDLSRISFEQADKLQDQWHKNLAKASEKKRQKAGEISFPNDNTETVHRFEDGWRIVRLVTPECKDIEGDLMGHCVGRGWYDDVEILSLRDDKNVPHATLEVDENKVINQVQGKANTPLKSEYGRYVLDFIDKSDYHIEEELIRRLGFYKVGNEYVDISSDYFKSGEWLPERWEGDLDLGFRTIESLGNLEHVGGNLDLRGTKVKDLGNLEHVGGVVDVSEGNIKLIDSIKKSNFKDKLKILHYL